MFKYSGKGKVISKKRNVEFDEGKHSRARLGFILMSTDLAGESDFFDMVRVNLLTAQQGNFWGGLYV